MIYNNIARTAIPNSITKGDVGIVVRLSPEAFAAAKKALQLLYDINQPENWPNTFASFKGDENLSLPFGAQLVVKGSELDDFVQLRDILIKDPDLVKAYNEMKRKYAGKDMELYRKEKSAFFEKLKLTQLKNS